MAPPKRYYEAEFGVWVEEPDPLRKPACGAVWNGEWSHTRGPRPRCYRERGHEGGHHEIHSFTGVGLVEYFWTDDPSEARSELRTAPGKEGPGSDRPSDEAGGVG